MRKSLFRAIEKSNQATTPKQNTPQNTTQAQPTHSLGNFSIHPPETSSPNTILQRQLKTTNDNQLDQEVIQRKLDKAKAGRQVKVWLPTQDQLVLATVTSDFNVKDPQYKGYAGILIDSFLEHNHWRKAKKEEAAMVGISPDFLYSIETSNAEIISEQGGEQQIIIEEQDPVHKEEESSSESSDSDEDQPPKKAINPRRGRPRQQVNNQPLRREESPERDRRSQKRAQRARRREDKLLETISKGGGRPSGKNKKQRGKASKHNRKEARRNKLEGNINTEEVLLHEPQIDKIEDNDSDSESDSDEQAQQNNQPSVPLSIIAEEFSSGLKSQGLKPFLSGGAAITYHGGPRPAGDLDFRIVMKEAGFSSFNESKGAAVLKYINQVMLPKSRQTHNIQNAQVNAFYTLGSGGLTIGTTNWFGVETSLSLVYFQPSQKINANDISPNNPDVDILSLEDLRADKLKSLVTRRKSGADSIKKIAKDLFDFISVSYLIDQREKNYKILQEIAETALNLSKVFKDGNLWNAATTLVLYAKSLQPEEELNVDIGEHLNLAAGDKLGEYSYANHDGRAWHDTSPNFVRGIIKARAVETTKTHLKKGERKDALFALIKEMTRLAKINGDLNSLDLLKAMPNLLRSLSSQQVPRRFSRPLKPWFRTWNRGPNFAPPKPFKRPKGPSLRPATKFTDEQISFRPASELLEEIGTSLDAKFLNHKLSDHEKNILRILLASDGFRALGKYNNIDTFEVFGMSKNQFDAAWKKLQTNGFVLSQEDGLHLTPLGKQTFS